MLQFSYEPQPTRVVFGAGWRRDLDWHMHDRAGVNAYCAIIKQLGCPLGQTALAGGR